MIDYKSIVEQLDTHKVIQLMLTLGADEFIEKPGYIIFPTICHNEDASDASMKLYYYWLFKNMSKKRRKYENY